MPRKKRKSKGSWTKENHVLLNGKGQIFRVNQSGDVYQLRMWIPEEKKYLRKSLRTRDLETAKERGEKLIFQTFSDVASGRRIFGVTLSELVEKYIEWRWKDVDAGDITEGRLSTIKTQMNHVLNYKDEDMKIAELDKNSFYDWAQWRKRTTGAKDVTIKNEYATINQMMEYAYREGYSHFPRFEFRKIKITKDEIGVRDIFTLDEYDRLVRYLRTYTSKKECPDDTQRRERLMVRDCILIASNTMLRVGELWNLKWNDVESIEKRKDYAGQVVHLATINVRAETSKVRTSRRIIVRGGEYISRLKNNNKYTSHDDFLFTAVDGASMLNRKKWYIHWKNIMLGIGIDDYKERQLSWYSLRHFAITCRIRSKNPYGEIAKVAGTSVHHIETHYAHYDDEMQTGMALQNFSLKKDGITFLDT